MVATKFLWPYKCQKDDNTHFGKWQSSRIGSQVHLLKDKTTKESQKRKGESYQFYPDEKL